MTTAEHPEFASEQAFLTHASKSLANMRRERAGMGVSAGDPKTEAALARLNERVLRRLDAAESICFGRIDPDAGDGPLYIGPAGIWDRGGSIIVVNWSAPAAEPFYEATFEDPRGIVLRRRFRTKREILLGISDEVLQEGTAVEATLDSFLLDELERDRTAEMRQVAATIQADQYRIIKRPLTATTVVQGGPGTGKTVVGLHRAAFLLYRHRNELDSARLLIVGPNPLFMQYIAYVLPSLGETAAVQQAVQSLGPIAAADYDEPVVARVKGDSRMAAVLQNAVADRVRPPTDDTTFNGNGVAFSISAATVATLVSGFVPGAQSYNSARMRFRSDFEREVLDAYAREYVRVRPGTVPTPLAVREMPEFDRALDRIWQGITGPELVRQLLSSEERLERAAAGVLTDAERRLLYRKPVERVDQVSWTTSDVALVDEVQDLVEPTAGRYGHVILDEAQDMTPMQLRMVGRRIRDSSATILGDLAQATGLWRYSSWDEILDHIGLETDADGFEELTFAYRVPREIMNLALPVLQLTAPSIKPPVAVRDGGEHATFIATEVQERTREVVEQAASAQARGGTTAIIAPTALLDDLRDELHRRDLSFGDGEHAELASSIELLDPIMAKGLEFDHVVMAEPAAVIRGASEGKGHQELYVALTRSMRTLTCVYAEPLPWPLGDPTSPGSPGGNSAPGGDIVEQLHKLGTLLERGHIDAEEFEALKARLLQGT